MNTSNAFLAKLLHSIQIRTAPIILPRLKGAVWFGLGSLCLASAHIKEPSLLWFLFTFASSVRSHVKETAL